MGGKLITYSQGVALYIGAILGSGILILPGYTAEVAGPASILSWVFLSVLSIPLAYTFARLALKYQDFGGIATIVNHAFGAKWSALVGWFFFSWVAMGQAVVGLTGAGYLVTVFHLNNNLYEVIAVLFLFVALITNIFGMKISGLFSLILSGIVLVLLVITIGFTLPTIETEHFQPFFPYGINGIGSAAVLIFWAFFGWESITHLVPEFQNPEKDVMRSTWTSVILIGVVYTLLSVVTVGTHTYGNHGSMAPLAVMMSKTLGFSASLLTGVIVSIVSLGTLNVYLASSSRLGYALANEGKFPVWFNKMGERGVPYRSAFFLFASNTLTVVISRLFQISIDKLILVPTTLGILVYVIAAFASVKILWNDRLGRISSLVALISILLVVPFIQGYFIAAVIISAGCCLFLQWKKLWEKKQLAIHNNE